MKPPRDRNYQRMFDDILLADGFDDALVGVSSKNIAVYDIDKCIEVLSKDMTAEEAMDYFYYNVEGAYMGEQTPIYIHSDAEVIMDNLNKKNFRIHKARA